ncbi:MAG: aminotransferase class I/II-fold pyridoxal phosphate-dependent enzyme [Ruminococcaceae bacterium]|nr:aminotransferase class I/II-fold pyridoxal phosphate-dependent enzyme [Oscillospiraceae bacterium]
MNKYSEMSKTELLCEYEQVKAKYEELCNKGLSLDMSRGKPGADQLDLTLDMFNLVNEESGYKTRDGIDCRNYGGVDGIPEIKELFAEIFGVDTSKVIASGNASLSLMFDVISQAVTHGLGFEPWSKQGKLKFLCPVPGYDRHFSITEYFGIEMINVPMTENGPDMDIVEELIKDSSVKGMWCVPKYSNPDGIVYSDETVKRLAAMKPAAGDFRIMWDNAYAIHPVFGDRAEILNILKECEKAGDPDKVIMFTSTSKITFPGAGVAALAASDNNIAAIKRRMSVQTIGPDKLNQLRHARLLPDMAAVTEHMKRHSAILAPKFDTVLRGLETQLGGLGIARWSKPQGGYFISMFVENGCAKRIVEMCREAGLVLTGAGATYPYGKDPDDSNIRIAPSFPTCAELEMATELLCAVTRLVCLEKLING